METLFRWIHLSDIHVGHGDAEHGWDQKLVMSVLLKDIADQVQKKHHPIDAVLVTGDIAFSGNGRRPTEYADAKAWFDELAKMPGAKDAQIYLVPGNHDVDRGADKDSQTRRLVAQLRRGGSDRDSKIDTSLADGGERAALARRMAAYLAFANDFAPARNRAGMPPEARLFWDDLLTTRRGLRVRLLGLNTALLAAGDDDQGKLQLGKEQLRPLTATEGELVMVLSHHPFVDGWLADQREADAWVRNHAHVHLSGHVHEADAEASRKGAGDVFVRVVAGSVHGDQGGPAGHGYSFGEVIRGDDGKAKIRIWPRKWAPKKAGFVLDVENVQDGEQHSEHELRLQLPVGPALAAPPTPIAASSSPMATAAAATIAPVAAAPPVAPAPAATGPVEVFISSCPADLPLNEGLQSHLLLLERKRLIKITNDKLLAAGSNVEQVIDEKLKSASIILILLSNQYLNWPHSQHDLDIARERYLARAARVIPIVLSPMTIADVHGSEVGKEWFEELIRLPRDGRPVTKWPDRDEVFTHIATELKEIVSPTQKPRS